MLDALLTLLVCREDLPQIKKQRLGEAQQFV